MATESLSRPFVSVKIQSTAADKNFIDLVVTNNGNSIAKEIKLNVSGDDLSLDHQELGHEELSRLGVIQRGIAALAPGESRNYYILSLLGRYEDLLKSQAVIETKYSNSEKTKKYSDSFTLDFGSLSDSRWVSEEMRATRTVAEELKKIGKTLASMERKK